MSVLVLLIVAGGLVAAGFLGGFLWAVATCQFDDLTTPPVRLLVEDPDASPPAPIRPPEGLHVD